MFDYVTVRGSNCQKFSSDCKIWPLPDLLVKFRRVLSGRARRISAITRTLGFARLLKLS